MQPLITIALALQTTTTLAVPVIDAKLSGTDLAIPLTDIAAQSTDLTDLQARDSSLAPRGICTQFKIGKYGWCGGCKRFETCSAYLAFMSGCASFTPTGVLACVGASGFLAANADYCLEGLCVCQGGKCHVKIPPA